MPPVLKEEILDSKITKRERKSGFVRLFTKTPEGVICPHFYELILSNGCPYNCAYCYLKLTFRGDTRPKLFNNPWPQVEQELEKIEKGVFSTGELADSLAIVPPLLEPAIEYFRKQKGKYLLLVTKSTNIGILKEREPTRQVIVSFSVNSIPSAKQFEKGCPNPIERLRAAKYLKNLGWRIRIRLDPIILETGLKHYEPICKEIAGLDPEMVTVGTLRQYPGLFNFSPKAPRGGLKKANDGRMRYSLKQRAWVYRNIEKWLGFQPALCKETKELWDYLGWTFKGCNCTVNE